MESERFLVTGALGCIGACILREDRAEQCSVGERRQREAVRGGARRDGVLPGHAVEQRLRLCKRDAVAIERERPRLPTKAREDDRDEAPLRRADGRRRRRAARAAEHDAAVRDPFELLGDGIGARRSGRRRQ